MAQAGLKGALAAGALSCCVLLVSINSGFAQQADKKTAARSSGLRRPDAFLQAGHAEFIHALAISPDQRWIASGGGEKTILLWDAMSGEPVARFTGHTSQIVGLEFSPDGTLLAATDYDGLVRVYKLSNRALLYSKRLGVDSRVAYSPDGKFWAAGVGGKGTNGTAQIELHESVSGEVVKTFATDWFGVTALTITADGRLIASGALEDEPQSPGSAHVWDMATGAMQKTWPISADAISPDGRWMGRIDYMASPHQAVVIDIATGAEKVRMPLKNEQGIHFSPDGKLFALTDPMSAQLKLCSIAKGEVRTLGTSSNPGELGLSAATFSADGKLLVAAPYADHTVKVWDTSSGREVKALYGQAMVQGLILGSGEGALIAGSPRGLDSWDTTEHKRARVLPFGYVNAFASSADGQWLAINPGVRFAGEKLAIVDTKSWRLVKEFSFDRGGTPVAGMVFIINDSPLKELGPLSRSFEFIAEDGRHTVWSAPSAVASTPDGKLMAIQFGGFGTVDVWDMVTGKKVTTFTAHGGTVIEMFFSPDGKSLLTTGQDSPVPVGYMPPRDWKPDWGVKVWDVATWKERMAVTFKRSGGSSMALSPDGHKIAVEKGWDRVDVIDAESGALVESLAAKDPNPSYHQWARQNVLFSADGKYVFQGAQDGIRVWKLSRP